MRGRKKVLTAELFAYVTEENKAYAKERGKRYGGISYFVNFLLAKHSHDKKKLSDARKIISKVLKRESPRV